MRKMRRKLTDKYGETRVRAVWRCRAKVGTMPGSVGYFLDEPKAGIMTSFVPDRPGSPGVYQRGEGVLIDEVRDTGEATPS